MPNTAQAISTAARDIYRIVAQKELDMEAIKSFTVQLHGDAVQVTVKGDLIDSITAIRTDKAVWVRLLVSHELKPLVHHKNPLKLIMINGTLTVTRESISIGIDG